MKTKTSLLLLAALLAGCATQHPTATMRVMSEVRTEKRTSIIGDEIVTQSLLISNVWNRQTWKAGGKTETLDWPPFSSQPVGFYTNVVGKAPPPVVITNTVHVTNIVEKATLQPVN